MDQMKIGKFISEQRKAKKMTQATLAEKLGITDRAVSKWERGKGMPDASIMLELCEILGITVNELLSAEKIEMEDYKKKTEELLVEMAQSEEEKNKSLLTAMWTITIVSIGSLAAALILVYCLMEPGLVQILVAIGVVIVFLIPAYIGLRLEVQAGYHECKNCHHKFVPTYREVLGAPHISTTRYLKCPECGKRTWCKKVLRKVAYHIGEKNEEKNI